MVEPVTIHDLVRIRENKHIIDSIVTGLTSRPKKLPSVLLYDKTGSQLYETITSLEEYYPTRIEKSLLEKIAPLAVRELENRDIVELGSGDCSKISLLLGAVSARRLTSIRYIPVDVSVSAIEKSSLLLRARFPGLRITGFVCDFTRKLDSIPVDGKRFVCFFGSTIGNLNPVERDVFFSDIQRFMRPGDIFLLGLDMIKPAAILERAYNDSRGLTAAFNRNILRVVNDITGTDFDIEAFEHLAFFNKDECRIEMHLKAKRSMRIFGSRLPGVISISNGETILTETSYKFSPSNIREFAGKAGFRVNRVVTDDKRWYSLVEFEKRNGWDRPWPGRQL
jgi:L-histidine N-alpha-methyltransferase